MVERRQSPRRAVSLFFNKYLDGQAYLCRSVDLSATALRAERFSEPASEEQAFPIELRLPEDAESLWIWVRALRSEAVEQVLEFVDLEPSQRERLTQFLAA